MAQEQQLTRYPPGEKVRRRSKREAEERPAVPPEEPVDVLEGAGDAAEVEEPEEDAEHPAVSATEERGVPVTAPQEGATTGVATVDAVAAKHLQRVEDPLLNPGDSGEERKRAELLEERRKKRRERRVGRAEKPTAYVEGESVVPSEELMVELRDRPTIHLDDAEPPPEPAPAPEPTSAKHRFTCLADINSEFEIGPIHHITVERKEPAAFAGQSIKGMLGKLRRPIDDDEFAEIFGGGKYALRVYGPHPHGKKDRLTGETRLHAFTNPIIYEVPGTPNVDIDHSRFGGPSQRQGNGMSGALGSRPATGPEANIVSHLLTTADKARESAEKVQHERLLETKQRTAEDTTRVTQFADAQLARAQQELERRDRTIEELRKEMREADERFRAELREIERRAQSAPRPESALMEGMRDIYSSQMSGAQQEARRAQDELRRETDRLRSEHQAARDRDREHFDDERRRLDERNRETVDRYERQLSDQRTTHSQQLEDERKRSRDALDAARRDYETQLDRQRQDYEQRLKDKAREIEHQEQHYKQLGDLKALTTETEHSGKIAQLNQEKAYLESELKRTRRELEEKGDLVEQLSKWEMIASQLGYKKGEGGDEGPKDWKEMLAGGFMDGVRSLPETLAQAKEALNARNLGIQMVAEQQRQALLMQQGMAPRQMLQQRPVQYQPQPQPQPQRPREVIFQSVDPNASMQSAPYREPSSAAPDVPADEEQKPGQSVQIQPPQGTAEEVQAEYDEEFSEGDDPEDEEGDVDDELVTRVRGNQLHGMIELIVQGMAEHYDAGGEDINAVVAQYYRQYEPLTVAGVANHITLVQVLEHVEVEHPDSDLLTLEGRDYVKNVFNAFRLQGKPVIDAAIARGEIPGI